MRDSAQFGYFPPGVKAADNPAHGGTDPFGFHPDPKAPAAAPVSGAEAFEDVQPGICPFCGKDFTGKPSPAASLGGHIRAKMGDGIHLP